MLEYVLAYNKSWFDAQVICRAHIPLIASLTGIRARPRSTHPRFLIAPRKEKTSSMWESTFHKLSKWSMPHKLHVTLDTSQSLDSTEQPPQPFLYQRHQKRNVGVRCMETLPTALLRDSGPHGHKHLQSSLKKEEMKKRYAPKLKLVSKTKTNQPTKQKPYTPSPRWDNLSYLKKSNRINCQHLCNVFLGQISRCSAFGGDRVSFLPKRWNFTVLWI